MLDILNGRDGKPSGRKVIGLALIVWGAVLLTIASIQPMVEGVTVWDVVLRLGPGGALVVSGAYFWGLVTNQMIKEITGNAKKESA